VYASFLYAHRIHQIDAARARFGHKSPPEGRNCQLRSVRRALTRTTTRAGRVGTAIERKFRSWPCVPQKGHLSGVVTLTGSPPIAIGASHRGQASVPTPSRFERIDWRFSSCPAAARSPDDEPLKRV
jgi:hypothetical protein